MRERERGESVEKEKVERERREKVEWEREKNEREGELRETKTYYLEPARGRGGANLGPVRVRFHCLTVHPSVPFSFIGHRSGNTCVTIYRKLDQQDKSIYRPKSP